MVSLTTRIDSITPNLFHNGNMDFMQRGTFNNMTGARYILDRFQSYHLSQPGGTNITVTQDTDVPTYAQSGFFSTSSMLTTIGGSSSSPTGITGHIYTMEGYDYMRIHGGGSCRLQFWVKSSIAGKYYMSLRSTSSNRNYVTSYTVNNANTWEKKTIDFVTDTVTTGNSFTNGGALTFFWVFSNGNAAKYVTSFNQWNAGDGYSGSDQTNLIQTNGATMRIAQVSLVPGAFSSGVDMPFQRCVPHYQQELALMQRYCETSTEPSFSFYSTSGALGSLGITSTYVALAVVGNTLTIPINFRTTKRIATVGGTTLRVYAANTGTADAVRDESSLTDRSVQYSGNGSRYNSNGGTVLVPTGVSGDFVEFHWIADTEF